MPRGQVLGLGGRVLRAAQQVLNQPVLVVQLAQAVEHDGRLQPVARHATQRPHRVPQLIAVLRHRRLRPRPHEVVATRNGSTVVSLRERRVRTMRPPRSDERAPRRRLYIT